ncbi:unnamed protein product [Diamesa serratosioi]
MIVDNTMKFIICVMLLWLSSVNSSELNCIEPVKNVFNQDNGSVYLIHSYGLSSNNTLTDTQKSLFLIQSEPVDKYLVISDPIRLRIHQELYFNVPFHSKMRLIQSKSKSISRCGSNLNTTHLIIVLDTFFKNYIFFYGCNLANGNHITVLMIGDIMQNVTDQEVSKYFDMPHGINKYKVLNNQNTGFCMCRETASFTVNCIQHQTFSGFMFFCVFAFICFVNATIMYAFDYITDFE